MAALVHYRVGIGSMTRVIQEATLEGALSIHWANDWLIT